MRERVRSGVTSPCGHGQTLEILVHARADVELAFDDGSMPAFLAAHNGYAGALRVLADAKADLNAARVGGGRATPAYMAAQEGDCAVLEVLVQAKIDVETAETEGGTTPVYVAASRGHMAALVLLLAVAF